MATIYYPSSSSLYSRIIAGGLSELNVNVAPDTIFILSGSSNFTTSLIPQLLLTGSTYDITASYAITSSRADVSNLATTASSAFSMLLPPSVYGSVSSSFNPITDLSQGTCSLRFLPDSGSYMDVFGINSSTTMGQQVKKWQDIASGKAVTCNNYNKYVLLTGTGPNNNKNAISMEYMLGVIAAYTSTYTLTTPTWFFWVGKCPPITGNNLIFDGYSARCGVWAGLQPQIYAGASFNGTITGSLAAMITGSNSWFLQSFKHNGGAGSRIRVNGQEALPQGNGGSNTVLGGFQLGNDTTSGNGGGAHTLEFLVYFNIADQDAYNIENWLMARYEIT